MKGSKNQFRLEKYIFECFCQMTFLRRNLSESVNHIDTFVHDNFNFLNEGNQE